MCKHICLAFSGACKDWVRIRVMATTSCCCSLQPLHIAAPIVSCSGSRWIAPCTSANLSSQSSCNMVAVKLARGKRLQQCKVGYGVRGRGMRVVVVEAGLLPVDPWAPNTDTQSIASSLFAASLLPYLGFLYHLTKSKTSPKLTLFGFYFLLAFVGATIPAGIYAKLHYGTSLSNVDWLHGGAESLLTLTNLFIVFGLRDAMKKPLKSSEEDIVIKDEKNVPLSK